MEIYKNQQYYLYGIKGAGMSALALILKKLGADVCGCDVNEHFFTEIALRDNNIEIEDMNGKVNFKSRQIIVGNVFWDKFEKGRRPIRYTDFIKQMEENFQKEGITTIAIAGTHGKTTTTKMLVDSLSNVVGLIGDGTGIVKGEPSFFVYEACEYRSNFLNYQPNIGVITNIDFDHPDYFKDLNHTIHEFESFANKCLDCVFINRNDENSIKIKSNQNVKTTLFTYPQKTESPYQFSFKGKYMIENFQSIEWILNLAYSNDFDKIQKAINQFTPPKRRYEVNKITNDNIVIDDYAHHPTEIAATFSRIKEDFPKHTPIIIFQPHTFSRTESLLSEFIEILKKFKQTYLLPVFSSARETSGHINSEIILEKMGSGEMWSDANILKFKKSKKQVILLCGAGNINELLKNKIINGMS